MDVRVTIDHDRCLGTGNCALSAADRFTPGEDGKAVARIGPDHTDRDAVVRGLTERDTAAICEAAMFCPPDAITVRDADSGEQYYP
jgi:ferredoxin